MTVKMIGPYQEEHIVRAASARKGVTAPEVADVYGCSRFTAWNTLERLRKAGRLIKTNNKRRRWVLFERAGRGAWVYVVNPGGKDDG